MSLVQLMVLLDVTVVNVALPRAQLALHFSTGSSQWIVTSYALAFGSLLFLGGRLSDLWGRRTSLFIGLVGFAAASALAGAANSFALLVSARALQGVFGALLAPAALAALAVTFTGPSERARAFTIYGVIAGSGAAIGLLLGGALAQWASWRWCLYVNVIFAALALLGALFFVPGGRREADTRLDALGTLLASAGLFCVVYGLSHAVNVGWSDPATWGALALGVFLLVGFVLWQRRAPRPLVPLGIFASRGRDGSLVALLLTSMGAYAVFLLLAYYLEESLGFSALHAGVAFLPLVVALALSATFVSARLLEMTGPRPLVPTGMLLCLMGLVLFTRLTIHSDYLGQVLPGLVLLGLGLGLIFAPAIASATAGVRRSDAGAASALVTTTQQIGASMGTAALNTVAVTVTLRALTHARRGSVAVSRIATLHGFSVAFWWAAGFFGLGAVLSVVLLESGTPLAEGEPAPA